MTSLFDGLGLGLGLTLFDIKALKAMAFSFALV